MTVKPKFPWSVLVVSIVLDFGIGYLFIGRTFFHSDEPISAGTNFLYAVFLFISATLASLTVHYPKLFCGECQKDLECSDSNGEDNCSTWTDVIGTCPQCQESVLIKRDLSMNGSGPCVGHSHYRGDFSNMLHVAFMVLIPLAAAILFFTFSEIRGSTRVYVPSTQSVFWEPTS